GSSGMALDVAKLLAKDDKVFILDIQEPLEKHQNFEFIKCDVSDFAEVNKAVESATRNNKIRKCFFCAGYWIPGTVVDTSIEALDKIFNVNVKGIIYALKAILPHMVQNNFGRIVIMGSNHALIATKSCAIYSMTKAACTSLAKTTAIDYADYNIRVNAVCPGSVRTPLMDKQVTEKAKKNGTTFDAEYALINNRNPIHSIASSQEVANLVNLMLSEEMNFMTGALVPIDGGTSAA
ncbi:MAG: SDR family NAD(P)-dependent oxidoreductase, partial [Gammaproteobacteria bacterium]|nr:SDR family NAD(P)-dependent oxidoreductase [Gammaproteobacteria bacterium]